MSNDALLYNKMVDLQERLIMEEDKIDTKFYVLLMNEQCWSLDEVIMYWLDHHAPPKNAYVENCCVQRDRGLVLTIKQRAVLLEIMRRQTRIAMRLFAADRIEVTAPVTNGQWQTYQIPASRSGKYNAYKNVNPKV